METPTKYMHVKHEKYEECKGCGGCEGMRPHHQDRNNTTLTCPCATCLVKVTCEKVCEDHFRYASSYYLSLVRDVKNEGIVKI